jgi:hypothetical protein
MEIQNFKDRTMIKDLKQTLKLYRTHQKIKRF